MAKGKDRRIVTETKRRKKKEVRGEKIWWGGGWGLERSRSERSGLRQGKPARTERKGFWVGRGKGGKVDKGVHQGGKEGILIYPGPVEIARPCHKGEKKRSFLSKGGNLRGE